MTVLIYDLVFLLLSLYILGKTIGYAVYEIKQFNNKSGGITIIIFSVIVVIFSNLMMWIN